MVKVTHKEKSLSTLESILENRAFPYAVVIAIMWWFFPISFGLYVILDPVEKIFGIDLFKSLNSPNLIGHIIYSIGGLALIKWTYTVFGGKK